MSEGKPRITAEELAALDAGTLNRKDLAKRKGVSVPTIGRWLKDPAAPVASKTTIGPYWPWKVEKQHQNSQPYNKGFDHLRYVIEGPDSLPEKRLRELHLWYATVKENREVLAYRPDAPPTPWRVKHGGFEYLEREPEDEDLLIRVPDPEWWTEERRAAWRFPKDLPEE
ncbi:hypothetical protein [Glycomyces sp. NPDC047010]|uniref:hypothetical protein n=1 Tax=Glycomyces sp. NPDC047010 TaxID=3155023 RepID=UPI0033F73F99